MNNNTPSPANENRVRLYLTHHALKPRHNAWFTPRVVNRLPYKRSSIPRLIMTVVTLVSVIMCGIILWQIPQHILSHEENNITPMLLCIYAATMSTIVLVILQVIRLIKTYF